MGDNYILYDLFKKQQEELEKCKEDIKT